jgi:hypothetical protein
VRDGGRVEGRGFRVDPGKAVYLGHIHLDVSADSGITPAAFEKGSCRARLLIRDNRAKDLARLPAGLTPERVEVRLLR